MIGTDGERIDPREVLYLDEVAEDARRHRNHAGRPSRGIPLMPQPGTNLDEQGYDEGGTYWGVGPMTTLIVATLAVAALVWLVFENAALHDALDEAHTDRDAYQARAIDLADRCYRLSVRAEPAEAVEHTWPFTPTLVYVSEPIHDGMVLDFCRGDVGGDAS